MKKEEGRRSRDKEMDKKRKMYVTETDSGSLLEKIERKERIESTE